MKFGRLFDKFVGRIFSDISLFKQENSKTERCLYQFRKEIKVSIPSFPKGGGIGGFGVKFDIPVKNAEENDKYIIRDEKLPQSPQSPQTTISADPIHFNCFKCDAPGPCYILNVKGRPLCELCGSIQNA